jgi:predicted patatin/cPLA2 family phospholipase
MNENENIKTGLVLEGGGIRGIYTAGVLDELMIQNIQVDGLIGVSAGIIHGVSYISGQMGRNVRYFLKYRNEKHFMSLYSLITSGNICGTDFCYDKIPNELSVFDYDTFRERAKEIPVYAGCSNLETGKPEYIRIYDVKEQMDAIRASASLPLVSEIVEYDGMKLLDGGSTDSIPVSAMRKLGFHKNIVVLTRPAGYQKQEDKTIPLMRRKYSEYPEYVDACEKRYLDYNEALQYVEYLEQTGEVLAVRPSRDLKVSRTEKNLDKIKRIYKLGRFDAQNMLDDIRKFMLS